MAVRGWSCVSAAEHGDVAIVTKDVAYEGSTHYAQGGISVVMGLIDDSVEEHIRVGPGTYCPPRHPKPVGQFRYVTDLKCPYRAVVKVTALRAEKRTPGSLPIQSCGQCVGARRGKPYTEIALLNPTFFTRRS